MLRSVIALCLSFTVFSLLPTFIEAARTQRTIQRTKSVNHFRGPARKKPLKFGADASAKPVTREQFLERAFITQGVDPATINSNPALRKRIRQTLEITDELKFRESAERLAGTTKDLKKVYTNQFQKVDPKLLPTPAARARRSSVSRASSTTATPSPALKKEAPIPVFSETPPPVLKREIPATTTPQAVIPQRKPHNMLDESELRRRPNTRTRKRIGNVQYRGKDFRPVSNSDAAKAREQVLDILKQAPPAG